MFSRQILDIVHKLQFELIQMVVFLQHRIDGLERRLERSLDLGIPQPTERPILRIRFVIHELLDERIVGRGVIAHHDGRDYSVEEAGAA